MSRLPAAVGLGLALLMAAGTAHADDGWNPFKERDQARRAERAATHRQERLPDDQSSTLPPVERNGTSPWLDDNASSRNSSDEYADPAARRFSDEQPAPWDRSPDGVERMPSPQSFGDSVQRAELQPLAPVPGMAPPDSQSASPLPAEFWQGLDMASIGEMIAPLSLPPHSGALAKLWQRLLSSGAGPAGDGKQQAASFDAVRMEALYRSGLVSELRKAVGTRQPVPNNPVENLLVARTRIVLGDREPGCAAIKVLQSAQNALPKPARREFLLLAALCGVGEGDAGKAGLAADLLRAEGITDPLALASLDALASGNSASFQMPATKSLSLLDYRFLELVNADPIVADAEPALLATVATNGKSPPARILAAEAALSLHAIESADLADAYRAATFSEAALAQPLSEPQAPPLQRALLFKALEAERSPVRKARLARALLDEIRRSRGPYMQVAAMLAPAIAEMRPAPDLAWFAETAIEINLAGSRPDRVRDWASMPAEPHRGTIESWLVLADISAAAWRGHRGEYLPAAEHLALSGKLAPELMHRLVTVLDALDYQIPIPLWEAASRTQQPATGFLPETGVLTDLQKASQQRQQGRVIVLALRALGPESGETAHMIALGDTIRALKRAGLEADARQLGLEALFMAWPRSRAD
ncbi:MAG: hypothetical protein AB7E81_14615 [Hyphomicrobiaceae bacterium]